MARYFGQESRRPAHRVPNGSTSSADDCLAKNTTLGRPQTARNSIQQDGSRAKETQRNRDHQKRRSDLKVDRSSSSTVPLRRPGYRADRVTYDHGDGSKTYNGVPDLSTREAQAVLTDADTRDNTGVDADDFADLFASEEPPPRTPWQPISTKPIQYGSSHHLPFNLHLHPPRHVQPSASHKPIRMINTYTPRESSDDGPLPGADAEHPSSPPSKAFAVNKHPANPYKGRDPIKRRVQNKLLRCILANKPLPKPRKQADRMVLKCTGRQEFR